jgi:hypothetical protein
MKSIKNNEGFNTLSYWYKSRPYTLTIENKTTNNIKDVVILDAARRYNRSEIDGVRLDCEPGNGILYNQFLGGLLAGEGFKCKKILMFSFNKDIRNHTPKPIEYITVENKDLYGNAVKMKLDSKYDGYNEGVDCADISYVFNVDALTKITISTLHAKTKLKIRLYPHVEVEKSIKPKRSFMGVFKKIITDPFIILCLIISLVPPLMYISHKRGFKSGYNWGYDDGRQKTIESFVYEIGKPKDIEIKNGKLIITPDGR